jgi:hypothetical protein
MRYKRPFQRYCFLFHRGQSACFYHLADVIELFCWLRCVIIVIPSSVLGLFDESLGVWVIEETSRFCAAAAAV